MPETLGPSDLAELDRCAKIAHAAYDLLSHLQPLVRDVTIARQTHDLWLLKARINTYALAVLELVRHL